MVATRVLIPSIGEHARDAAGALPGGLSTAEVELRQRPGGKQATALPTGRSYLKIFRDNLLTFINAVLFSLAVALIVLGRTSDALVSVGVVAVNMAVGLIQEIRAKRVLDRIAVLTRPRVAVVRAGLQQMIDPSRVVMGDLLVAAAGDQIVADGVVVGDRAVDVDESLLTGESDRAPKRKGDRVFAGSFCAGGTLEYVAEQVGAESTANRLAASARAFRRVLTPLQHEINRVVRVSLAVVMLFEVLVALANALDRTPLVESVRMAVVIAGLIPNGLFLAIAVAYAMSAVRIAGRGALVQQANAVESLSHVDVLCLDKTGTLTTNRFTLAQTLASNGSDAEFRTMLGTYAASSSDSNRTLVALGAALPRPPLPVIGEVLFSSARKWSAVSLDDPSGVEHYILGAPDVLETHLRSGAFLPAEAKQWASAGLRVLLLARAALQPEASDHADPCAPDGLDPLGLVALSQELRPHVAQTLAEFAALGVQLSLLSGDVHEPLPRLRRQAGMSSERLISGSELAQLDADELCQIALNGGIFGRLAPDQKENIVNALRASGHYVAMIGDGVNDVPALKAANLAIAMESGTAVSRTVSDIVLLQDNFGSLPFALREGQRIRGGMHAILKLFLTRVLYMAMLIVMTAVVDIGFPFAPKQNALLTLLTVGLPTLALAAWARPMEPRQQASSLFAFVIPAACALAIMGMSVYMGYLLLGPLLDRQSAFDAVVSSAYLRSVAQTALTTASVLCGLLLILLVQPLGELISSWRDVHWKNAALALVLLAGFSIMALDPNLRVMFELQPLSAIDGFLLAFVAVVWAAGLRWMWRRDLLARLLGTSSQPQRVST